MQLQDIHLRDPFILQDGDTYYMYGSTDPNIWGGECYSFAAYRTNDLCEFEGPFIVFSRPKGFWANEHYWAPEVHRYKDAYYLFAAFRSEAQGRRCQILRADNPLGPFTVFCDPFTMLGWECLDATLWVEEGVPYAVFCHEWVQTKDGTMELVRLHDDLSGACGQPVTLFRASSAPWVGAVSYDGKFDGYITDGPFLHRLESGKLLMIWSSCTKDGAYAVGMAVSDSGKVAGPWRHMENPLFAKDGGHACLFRKDGKLHIAMHAPNVWPNERLAVYRVEEADDCLRLGEQV